MSLSTTLGLVKTLKMAGSQAVTRKSIEPASVQQAITWAGSQQSSRALEAVLLIVNQDVEEPNDPRVESLFRSLYLQDKISLTTRAGNSSVNLSCRPSRSYERSRKRIPIW